VPAAQFVRCWLRYRASAAAWLSLCSKHVLQLEAILKKRRSQLRVLEVENHQLKQKDRALQSCILGIEGSVAAIEAVLEVEADAENTSSSGSLVCTVNTASLLSARQSWSQSGNVVVNTTAQVGTA
jgi:hypothetical protein